MGCKTQTRLAFFDKNRYICQNVQQTTNKKRVQPWLQYFYCIITLNYLKKRFIYRTSSEPIARSSRYYQGDIILVRSVITFVAGRLAIQFFWMYVICSRAFLYYSSYVIFPRIRIRKRILELLIKERAKVALKGKLKNISLTTTSQKINTNTTLTIPELISTIMPPRNLWHRPSYSDRMKGSGTKDLERQRALRKISIV